MGKPEDRNRNILMVEPVIEGMVGSKVSSADPPG
jgi:hypothetical protein